MPTWYAWAPFSIFRISKKLPFRRRLSVKGRHKTAVCASARSLLGPLLPPPATPYGPKTPRDQILGLSFDRCSYNYISIVYTINIRGIYVHHIVDDEHIPNIIINISQNKRSFKSPGPKAVRGIWNLWSPVVSRGPPVVSHDLPWYSTRR